VKILFDQNISFRLLKRIANNYPEAKQIRKLGLENSTDLQIWKYAKKNGYSIVSFDGDFFDLVNVNGHPPKVIWLRMGNTSIESIAKLFNNKVELIRDFLEDPKYDDIAFLEIE